MRRNEAGPGRVRRGEARQGEAGRVEAWWGEWGQGGARRGVAGEVGQGRARGSESGRGETRRGWVRWGQAVRSGARRGEARRGRAISSPTILRFSSDSRRRGCLTGFASSRTCSLCSENSFGTPSMSLGDHAKMSRFSWRKSASSPSYLLFRFAPMTANLSGCSGSRGIFFVSLVGWKDPWEIGRAHV